VYSLCVFYYSVLSCVADVADCPLQRLSAIVIKNIIIIIIIITSFYTAVPTFPYDERMLDSMRPSPKYSGHLFNAVVNGLWSDKPPINAVAYLRRRRQSCRKAQ